MRREEPAISPSGPSPLFHILISHTKAPATATSWAGTCRGTQHTLPSANSSSGARSACSTSCATYGTATASSKTYWTKRRRAEAMDYSYALMDLTVYGRQEPWEDSPPRLAATVLHHAD
jgi:hypothetical protein